MRVPHSLDGSTDDRRTIRSAASAAMPAAAFAGPVPVTVTTFGKFLLVEATFFLGRHKAGYEVRRRGKKEGRKGARSLRPRGSLPHSLTPRSRTQSSQSSGGLSLTARFHGASLLSAANLRHQEEVLDEVRALMVEKIKPLVIEGRSDIFELQ